MKLCLRHCEVLCLTEQREVKCALKNLAKQTSLRSSFTGPSGHTSLSGHWIESFGVTGLDALRALGGAKAAIECAGDPDVSAPRAALMGRLRSDTPACGRVSNRPFSSGHQREAKRQSPHQEDFAFLVPVTGLEPVRCCQRRILSPLRLPISSHRHS